MPTVTGIATSFIDFTRASNATVTDSDGRVKWAPHNLLTNSESFDAAAWTKVGGLAISANSAVAPNGTTTADLFTEDTATSDHYVAYTFTGVSGPSYTFSVFVKPNGRTWIILNAQDGTRKAVWFNCTGAGSVGTTDAGVTGASIAALSNGWYLLTSTRTAAASTFYPAIIPTTGDGVSPPYLGNGTSGVYLWGASLYRSDLAMQPNTSAYPMYNPTTPKNLLGYTEDFSVGTWVKSGIAAFGSGSISNEIVAPNGLQTADRLVENTVTGEHFTYQQFSKAAVNGIYTMSAYAKLGPGSRNVALGITNGATGGYSCVFNLTTSATTVAAVGTPTGFTAGTPTITPLSNSWFRLSFTVTTDTATRVDGVIYIANGTTLSYAGDNTSGIYLWGAQLSDSASLDPYVPVYGAAVTSAAYYGPRRDFDASTLACNGLLVEEQRTNLLLYSAQFDNASGWFGPDVTVTANNATAPDGTMSADKLVYNINSAYLLQDYTTTTAGAYTGSLYLRADSATTVILRVQQSGGAAESVTCSVTTSWQRFSVTLTSVAPTFIRVNILANANTPTVYAWGAQLEAAYFATSYIPTGSASATRNADIASVSAQAFPYGASEGTLVANASWANAAVATLTNQRIALMSSPGDNYARSIQRQDGSATGVALFYRGMSSGVNIATSGSTAKSGLAWSSAGGSGSVNGSAASALTGTPTTSDGLPINILRIGNAGDNTFFNGHIRQITYLPRRISNADLVTRST